MTEQLFKDVDNEVKIVEGDDGSIKIGETFYKSKEEAFKGKAEADKHISITQAENKELRDQVKTLQDTQSTALQKLLERVDETTHTQSRSRVEDDYSYDSQTTTDTTPTIDPEKVRAIVQEQVQRGLDEHDQTRSQQDLVDRKVDNLAKIREALIKSCGSKEDAKVAWESYVAAPDFDKEIYEMQVLRQPDKLAENITPVTPVSFGSTNINTSSYTGGSQPYAGPKPRSHYAKIMKEHPREYRKPELQRQMRADAQSLGMERFLAT